MNKFFWGAYDNEKGTLLTTKAGTPALVPSRSVARSIVAASNKGGKKFKVVRVAFNIEQRLHSGAWTPINQ